MSKPPREEAEPPLSLAGATERHSLSAHRAAEPKNKSENRNRELIAACAAAAEDLKATRVLADALENENRALKVRLETERQTTILLLELNETRKSETEALRSAVTAKNETIAAKDAVITSQDKLIETLKRKKTSPWKRLSDVLIGAAVFAILK